ncbi:MAG: glycosyltransferase [Pedobacter sp.]|nr:MAG: glycosyltransferase [Pedobacter sp.]
MLNHKICNAKSFHKVLLTVILPTYNPNLNRLNEALRGLKNQLLSKDEWELIIVDNNSNNEFQKTLDLTWHANAKIIREAKQGLTYARLKGFKEASGDIIVMVDDDNLLDKNYLKNAVTFINENQEVGACGGKSLPIFETTPPLWINTFYSNLALRDLGEITKIASWDGKYPELAPIGAGMVLQKLALKSYIDIADQNISLTLDRTGNSLSSGGDNEIVIEVLKSGWSVGYVPCLVLHHIIPKDRIETSYLAKLLNNTNKSWVQLLKKHNINPWKTINVNLVFLHKAKAFFTYKAWKNSVNYIKWRGACGLFDGLVD